MIYKTVRKVVSIRPGRNQTPVFYVLIPREIRHFYESRDVVVYYSDDGVVLVLPKDDPSLLRKFLSEFNVVNGQ